MKFCIEFRNIQSLKHIKNISPCKRLGFVCFRILYFYSQLVFGHVKPFPT